MKFIVKSGKVTDCVIREDSGRRFYVTPKKGWFVAKINDDDSLTLADGCAVHTEEATEEDELS